LKPRVNIDELHAQLRQEQVNAEISLKSPDGMPVRVALFSPFSGEAQKAADDLLMTLSSVSVARKRLEKLLASPKLTKAHRNTITQVIDILQ